MPRVEVACNVCNGAGYTAMESQCECCNGTGILLVDQEHAHLYEEEQFCLGCGIQLTDHDDDMCHKCEAQLTTIHN